MRGVPSRFCQRCGQVRWAAAQQCSGRTAGWAAGQRWLRRLKVLTIGLAPAAAIACAKRSPLHRHRLLTACFIDASIPQGHPLTEFDGCKRSCRKALQKHNERRCVAVPACPASWRPLRCCCWAEPVRQNWKLLRQEGVQGGARRACGCSAASFPATHTVHWLMLSCHITALLTTQVSLPCPPLACRTDASSPTAPAVGAQQAQHSQQTARLPPPPLPRLQPHSCCPCTWGHPLW